jgi:hypothetical protein
LTEGRFLKSLEGVFLEVTGDGSQKAVHCGWWFTGCSQRGMVSTRGGDALLMVVRWNSLKRVVAPKRRWFSRSFTVGGCLRTLRWFMFIHCSPCTGLTRGSSGVGVVRLHYAWLTIGKEEEGRGRLVRDKRRAGPNIPQDSREETTKGRIPLLDYKTYLRSKYP